MIITQKITSLAYEIHDGKNLEINLSSVGSFAFIFSHSGGCLLTLLIVFFAVQKILSLIRSHLLTFVFYFHYSRRWVIEDLALTHVIKCSAHVFL